MRILVTGGPTHEYLDDVRYLGNPSTGAMGIAIAEAARDLGHEAVLVLGPSPLPSPSGIEVVRVVSAIEMRDAVLARLEGAGAFVAAAAVADYRPRTRAQGKIKKAGDELVLNLTKNPDILEEVGRMGGDRIIVGFALEAAHPEAALANAREKLLRKRCDLVVLNRAGSLGGARAEDVVLVFRGGSAIPLGAPDKRSLAERIVRFCESTAREREHEGVIGKRGSEESGGIPRDRPGGGETPPAR